MQLIHVHKVFVCDEPEHCFSEVCIFSFALKLVEVNVDNKSRRLIHQHTWIKQCLTSNRLALLISDTL